MQLTPLMCNLWSFNVVSCAAACKICHFGFYWNTESLHCCFLMRWNTVNFKFVTFKSQRAVDCLKGLVSVSLWCTLRVLSGEKVHKLRTSNVNRFLFFGTRAAGTCNNTAMASPEDVIEPALQSSTAQNLDRRRFLQDLHNLSPDEIDGLMSSSGKNNSPLHTYIKLKLRAPHWNSNGCIISILLKCSYLPNHRGSSFPCGASSSWNKRDGCALLNAWYPYYMQSGQHREIHHSLKGTFVILHTFT